MSRKGNLVGFGASQNSTNRSSKPKRGRDPKTDKKRKKYERNRAKGMNKTQAALAADFSLSMAKNAAVKIETPEMVARLAVSAAVAIPDPVVIEKLKEGTEAYTVVIARSNGKISQTKAFPDFRTRLEYLRLRMELTGDLPTSKSWQPSSDGTPQQITNIMVVNDRIGQLLGVAAARRVSDGERKG